MAEAPQLEEAVEFAENPEPRCPCVLLLDTSSSMRGAPIQTLNEGLQTFATDLRRDALAVRRVEVAVVTFDSDVRVVQDFATVEQLETPILTAQGYTHMGSAIHQALDMLQIRKEQYRANGIAYYRPRVFMITDGEPQDEPDDVVESAAQRIKEEEAGKRVAFFAVGVENANMVRLAEIAVWTPMKLKGLNFVDMEDSLMPVQNTSMGVYPQAPMVPSGGYRWQVIAASAGGTSHQRRGQACQDAHYWRTMDNDVPVAAVADGAGAVALGKVGATMAVYTATTTVCARQQSAAWPESDSDWHECLVEAVHAAQATLAAEARARQVTVREFATTLILAVATPELVAVVQIGDGAVVVGDQEGNLLSLTVPQNGEYANETTFLSSPNALATAQVCVAWYASACDGLL